jgi:hypothetical protein
MLHINGAAIVAETFYAYHGQKTEFPRMLPYKNTATTKGCA